MQLAIITNCLGTRLARAPSRGRRIQQEEPICPHGIYRLWDEETKLLWQLSVIKQTAMNKWCHSRKCLLNRNGRTTETGDKEPRRHWRTNPYNGSRGDLVSIPPMFECAVGTLDNLMSRSGSWIEHWNELASSRSLLRQNCTQLWIDIIGWNASLQLPYTTLQSLLPWEVIVALPLFRSKIIRPLRRSIRLIPNTSTRPAQTPFMPTSFVVDAVVRRWKTSAATIIIVAVQSWMTVDMKALK